MPWHAARSGLLEHAEMVNGRMTVQLHQSKRQIAARLGIAPETLSRVLRQLRDQGLLEGLGKTFFLPQPAQLQLVVQG